MEKSDWAWLAGLIEGEGCIVFTDKNSVALVVKMTDLDIIQRCYELTGRGYLIGPQLRAGTKDLYGWSVTRRDDVLFLLTGIRPWLGVRRGERTDAALMRLEKVRRPGHCHRGHKIADENLYRSPKGQAFCRECLRIRDRGRRKSQVKS